MSLRPEIGAGDGANLAQLTTVAGCAWDFDLSPCLDGFTRRVPLLVEHEAMLYPSLALDVRGLLPGDAAAVDFGRESTPDGRAVTESRAVGSLRLPVDEKARVLVPFFARAASTPTESAGDVLAGQADAGKVRVSRLWTARSRVSSSTPASSRAPSTADCPASPTTRRQPCCRRCGRWRW